MTTEAPADAPSPSFTFAAALIAAATIVLDQVSKLWVLGLDLAPGQRISVFPFADIVLTYNPGISYGLFPFEGRTGQFVLAGFAGLVALGLTVWLFREMHSAIARASLGLIIGGAIGNAIDRLYLPGVVDFVSLHAYGASWYVFNVADVAIVAGVLGLLYDSFVASRGSAANGR
ncbi:MAG: signal peptidase II [Pseudomonadota bacterium]